MTTRRRSRTLTLLAALAGAFVVLPLLGVALRLPWSDAWSLATSATARRAAWVSLQTSVVAAVLAAVLGIPLGWWLAQANSRPER